MRIREKRSVWKHDARIFFVIIHKIYRKYMSCLEIVTFKKKLKKYYEKTTHKEDVNYSIPSVFNKFRDYDPKKISLMC